VLGGQLASGFFIHRLLAALLRLDILDLELLKSESLGLD
jgi:hypothetical protein